MAKRHALLLVILISVLIWFTMITVSAQKRIYLPIIIKPRVTIGPPITMYNSQQRRDICAYWPDGNIGRVGDKFFAACGDNILVTTGTIDDIAESKYAATIFTDQNDLDYIGGGPVFESDGKIVLIYHAEKYLSGYQNFRSFLGVAISYDNGLTFYDSGLIIEANAPGVWDVGGGGFAIKDEYIYVCFKDKLQSGQINMLSVARASIDDVVAGHPEFYKYYNGDFSEPGMGGLSSSLANVNAAWLDVTTVGNETWIVYSSWHAINLIYSSNGVDWSEPIALVTSIDELFYPSFIEDSTGLYLFYSKSAAGGFDRWSDGEIIRRKIHH